MGIGEHLCGKRRGSELKANSHDPFHRQKAVIRHWYPFADFMRSETAAIFICVLVACHQAAETLADRGERHLSPAALAVTATKAGPAAVVNLLLEWDTAGLRFDSRYGGALRRMYCYIPDQDCLSPEPGWDMLIAVRGYKIQTIYEGADSAAYAVQFDAIGTLSGESMEAASGTQLDTLWLRRFNGAWRIVGVESQMPPHLSPTAAYRVHARLVSDTAQLAAWLGLHR